MRKSSGYFAAIFSVVIALVSLFVAYLANGKLISTVYSTDLLRFGAADGTIWQKGEIWRILTSQFVHAKQGHMFFNVAICWMLGACLERILGSIRFTVVYWLGGTIGLLSSLLAYPQLVSSGSSQALMALCAGIFVLKRKGVQIPKAVMMTNLAAFILQTGLDLYVNHFPKAGHVAGFFSGGLICWVFLRKPVSNPISVEMRNHIHADA